MAEGSVDRISALPESLISSILSSLPTKDAVATSILSSNWRFRWTKVTSFRFDNTSNGGERFENQIHGDASQTMDFVDFVNLVLRKHCGEAIDKFLLWWESPKSQSMCLYTWVDTAITRRVRVLVLNLKTGNTLSCLTSIAQQEFHLPDELYSSRTLEILKLEGPFRVKPPNVVCLRKLVQLDLAEVTYESDESVQKLISGCPVLESLRIVRKYVRDNLVICSISSPLLKKLVINFHYSDLHGDNDLKLRIEAPALEDLYLYDRLSCDISIKPQLTSVKRVILDCGFCRRVADILPSFSQVEYLTIEEMAMLAIEGEKLNVSFERLVRLAIIAYRPEWSCLMDLIYSCIKLEELEVRCGISGGDSWRDPVDVPGCLIASLRHLTIEGFDNGLKKEDLAMLKYFLANGFKLETVCLRLYVNGAKLLKILNKVSAFSRASPICKITLA